MVMEDFMEAEAERERRANELREQRLEACFFDVGFGMSNVGGFYC